MRFRSNRFWKRRLLKEQKMKTTFFVDGMTCEHCVKHVTEAIKSVAGVKKASVNLKTKKAEVDHADSVTPDALKAAVIEAGYQVPA
jgi:copper ion binding protein